jgi:hypothetical protein
MRKFISVVFASWLIFLTLIYIPIFLVSEDFSSADSLTSKRAFDPPVVITQSSTEITNTSVRLTGQLVDTGGEECSVWFEWDEVISDECAGLIATGTVCKDGRSIILKNRHAAEADQQPRFYKGTNYAYFGVGSLDGMNRMGQNEVGLAIGNYDVSGTLTSWQFTSDGASGSEDNDHHVPLGNFSTVAAAAYWLAQHGTHPGQSMIISSEPGVGAIVAIDSNLHTMISWVNNTYAAIANAFYCEGAKDIDGNDIRVREILDDIVDNGTSSSGDTKINWRDVAQRIAKDTNDKEYIGGAFSYADEISRGSSRSAMVAVAGDDSFGGAVHMSWLNFAPTTKVGIFLPVYAGALKSSDDIPSSFITDNDGKGIYPYGVVKHNYAGEGLGADQYYCSRILEILKYTNYNENITFDGFDSVLTLVESLSDSAVVKEKMGEFVNNTLPIALKGYIHNMTTMNNYTFKQQMVTSGSFSDVISGLRSGTLYRFSAHASNTKFSINGSEKLFLTKPDAPTNAIVNTLNQTRIKLTWTIGIGALQTVVERHIEPSWFRGEGTVVFNGTSGSIVDTGLESGTHYYYQFWSYTSVKGLFQYSSNFAYGEATTRLGNRPPEILTEPVSSVTENELYTVKFTYRDLDGDTVSWAFVTNATWLSMVGNNLSGTPSDFDSGPYFVNVTCDDNNGSAVFLNYTLSITPSPDSPMIISIVPDIQFNEDEYFTVNLSGLGIDSDGDSLTWYFVGADPDLFVITPVSTEIFNISGVQDKFGDTQVVLYLEDSSPERLSAYQKIWINISSVNDRPQPPEISYEIVDADPLTVGDQNLTVIFNATPVDVDSETINTFNWDFDGDGVPDLSGQVVNYTYPSGGNYTVNLTHIDSGGLSNWNLLDITVSAPMEPDGDGDKNGKKNGSSDDSSRNIWLGVIISIIIVIALFLLLFFKKRSGTGAPEGEKENKNTQLKNNDGSGK